MIADDTEISIKGNDIYLVGNILNISAVLDPVPEEAVTYQWLKEGVAIEGKTDQNLNLLLKDDVSDYSLEVTFEDESVGTLEFKVRVSAGLYNAHIEPLEHRNSGFTRISFGELDQIVAYNEAEVDWKTKIADIENNTAVAEIAEYLTENPDAEIEVQESRNGRILDRAFFEAIPAT